MRSQADAGPHPRAGRIFGLGGERGAPARGGLLWEPRGLRGGQVPAHPLGPRRRAPRARAGGELLGDEALAEEGRPFAERVRAAGPVVSIGQTYFAAGERPLGAWGDWKDKWE